MRSRQSLHVSIYQKRVYASVHPLFLEQFRIEIALAAAHAATVHRRKKTYGRAALFCIAAASAISRPSTAAIRPIMNTTA